VFTALSPAWALSTFGFIAIALISVPFLLFIFGAKWRARSRYAGDGMITEGQEEAMDEVEMLQYDEAQ
jgi:cbb3-type cytochrome oxidase subunit 3